jgi:hypothetical protein
VKYDRASNLKAGLWELLCPSSYYASPGKSLDQPPGNIFSIRRCREKTKSNTRGRWMTIAWMLLGAGGILSPAFPFNLMADTPPMPNAISE